jgi:hypothetical protein
MSLPFSKRASVNSNSFLAGLNMRPYLTHTSESRVRADSDTRRLSLPVSQRVTNVGTLRQDASDH